jgi:predicted phage terminase large subunit-like protein
VVLDVVRLRGSPWEVEKAIFAAAEADGRAVHIGLPEDPGQAGKAQSSYLTGLLAGYHVVTTRETGSKYLRAQPLASQVEAGNVAFVRGPWNRAFLDELRDFPHGGKDDQVDAFVRAFGTLNSVGAPSRSLKIAFLSR